LDVLLHRARILSWASRVSSVFRNGTGSKFMQFLLDCLIVVKIWKESYTLIELSIYPSFQWNIFLCGEASACLLRKHLCFVRYDPTSRDAFLLWEIRRRINYSFWKWIISEILSIWKCCARFSNAVAFVNL
jgi:hypothetical protein